MGKDLKYYFDSCVDVGIRCEKSFDLYKKLNRALTKT